MSKVWLIAGHHYKQEVLKRSFIIVMLSLPLFLGFSIGMGYLGTYLETETSTAGYVDEAGLLVSLPEPSKKASLVPFQTVEEAQAALDAGTIDGYYVLPRDYSAGGQVDLVYSEPLQWAARNLFRNAVRMNLLADQPPEIAARALPGARLTVRAPAYNREFPGGDPSAGQVIPIAVGIVFAFLSLTTAGYLMGVLVEEKENRTMEIIVSSVSTGRMMLGKTLAGIGIGLTLLVVWSVFLGAAVWLGQDVLEVAWLQDINVVWRDVVAVLVVALPSYLVIAALMTMIGTVAGGQQEADQLGPFVFLVMLLPVYLFLPISRHPDGILAIGLSLFPPTAVMTIGCRSLFREIPNWQIATSALVGLATGIVLVWLAGKAFQTSLLRYGKRLRWRELFRTGRNGESVGSELKEA